MAGQSTIFIEGLPDLPELESLMGKTGQPSLETLVLDENGEPALDSAGKPFFSAQENGLQFQNQLSLWKTLKDSDVRIPRGPWLDAGCGKGLFFSLAPHLLYSNQGIGRPQIIGVDMGRENTTISRAVAGHVKLSYRMQTTSPQRPEGFNVAIDVLNPQKLQEYRHLKPGVGALPPLAVVWSNQVFHWIKSDEDKYATLERLYSSMKPGGVLALSMSSSGTAKHFLQAYIDTIQALGMFRLPDHTQGYKSALFEYDPIGSQGFDKMATMIEEMGFDIASGVARRETVRYLHPLNYAEAVRQYGYDIFMRSVAHLLPEEQERIWTDIGERFMEVLKISRAWNPEGPHYEYRQNNLYFVATKRVARPSEGPLRKPLEPSGNLITSYLNPVYLSLGLGSLARKEGRAIEIQLKKGLENIDDITTQAPLERILIDVVKQAARDWDKADEQPRIMLSYELQQDAGLLLLQMQLKTIEERKPEEIFDRRTLRAAQATNVGIELGPWDKGMQTYTFTMPILE